MPVPALVNTISRARDWYDQIVSGEIRSVRELAATSGLLPRHTRRILGCVVLSPKVVEAILTGKRRPDLTVKEFLKPLPIDWREQEKQILRIANRSDRGDTNAVPRLTAPLTSQRCLNIEIIEKNHPKDRSVSDPETHATSSYDRP